MESNGLKSHSFFNLNIKGRLQEVVLNFFILVGCEPRPLVERVLGTGHVAKVDVLEAIGLTDLLICNMKKLNK